MNNEIKTNFVSVLGRLETQLETPVVPGELASWLNATEELFRKLQPALRAQLQSVHTESFEAISEFDSGLLTRVENLKLEDDRVLAECERLLKMVSPVAQHSDKLEPDEGRGSHAVEKIVDEGLKLVIRIRKQEVAIETWFSEALERDRGVAD